MATAASKNVRFLSRCDQGGRYDGVQIIVHKGHAFIGHMFSGGVTGNLRWWDVASGV